MLARCENTADSSGWGVIHGGGSASATVNVTFAGDLTGSNDVAWWIQGDIYGADPHTLSGTVTLTAAGPAIARPPSTGTEAQGFESLGVALIRGSTDAGVGDSPDIRALPGARDGGVRPTASPSSRASRPRASASPAPRRPSASRA